MLRILTVGLGAIALAPVAAAQFDGPAPLAWRFIQPTRIAPMGSPLVVENRVYQSIGGRVVCVDRETGNLRFRFPAVDPIPGVFRSSPVLATNGLIVAAGDNKIVYAFDATTGDLKWSFNLPGGLFGQPVAVGKYVVCAQSDNKLVAIDVETGEAGWQNPFNILDGINGQLAAYRNSVVLFTNRNELLSLDVTSLKFDWRRPLAQVYPNSVPVVFGEDVFLVSGGYLIQINAGSGVPRWQVPTGQTLNLPPTVSSAGVLVISQDGKAMMFDPVARQQITKKPIELGTLPVARATAVGDKFIVPTTIGGLVLVDPAKGSLTWEYLIRPIGDASQDANNNAGGGVRPGLGGGAGFGGAGGGNQNNAAAKPVTIQPAAQPVLAGTTLLVPAKDGSVLAFDSVSGVDLTGPKVEMQFPNPGDQVSGQPPLLLLFKVEDIASGLKTDSLKVSVGDQVLEHKLERDGRVVVRFSQTGKNKPLSNGRKEIVVTAVDWMGNITKQTYALTIDNTLPPIRLPGTQDPNQPGGAGFPGGGLRGGGTNGDFK